MTRGVLYIGPLKLKLQSLFVFHSKTKWNCTSHLLTVNFILLNCIKIKYQKTSCVLALQPEVMDLSKGLIPHRLLVVIGLLTLLEGIIHPTIRSMYNMWDRKRKEKGNYKEKVLLQHAKMLHSHKHFGGMWDCDQFEQLWTYSDCGSIKTKIHKIYKCKIPLSAAQ